MFTLNRIFSLETSKGMRKHNLNGITCCCNDLMNDFTMASKPYMSWVCCWFSPFLLEIFLWVLRFSQHKDNITNMLEINIPMYIALMHLSIETPPPPPPHPGPRWGFDLTSLQILANSHPTGAYWQVKPPPRWGNLFNSLTDFINISFEFSTS